MATKGIERVRANSKREFNRLSGPVTERAVYALLSQGAAYAATLTPIDTSALINSQYAPQIKHSKGQTDGYVGYTSSYAGWVHDMPGTLKGLPRADFGKTGNQSGVGPVQPRSFGGGTGNGRYWDPNAEPGFLEKGFAAVLPIGPNILRKHYRV